MRTRIVIVLISLILAGCDLLGNQQPQQSEPLSDAYNTTADLQNALTGAYSDLQDGDIGGAQWVFLGEIIADNTVFTGSFPTYQQVAQHAMNANNNSIEPVWTDSYQAINDVNIILHALPNVKDAGIAAARDAIEGQCLFIRGITLFYLVNFYGKPWQGGPDAENNQPGVPIVLKPVTKASDFTYPSRASVSQVYDQIKSDLQKAASLLPDFVSDGRANKYAALGILLKVAMQQHDYQTAIDLSNEIMTSNNYSLNSDVKTFFTSEFSPESIFEISNTTLDNPGVNEALSAEFNANSRGDVHVSQGFMTALDDVVTADQKNTIQAAGDSYVDTRKTELLTVASGQTFSLKYEDYVNNSDNAPILRYAEVLLDRAEALARVNGIDQESIDLLNQVRERAIIVKNLDGKRIDSSPFIDYEAGDFATAQDLIDKILLERRVELAFEGQRYFDLNRLDKPVNGDPAGSNNLIFPIPQREIDANKHLTQNPGYGGS